MCSSTSVAMREAASSCKKLVKALQKFRVLQLRDSGIRNSGI